MKCDSRCSNIVDAFTTNLTNLVVQTRIFIITCHVLYFVHIITVLKLQIVCTSCHISASAIFNGTKVVVMPVTFTLLSVKEAAGILMFHFKLPPFFVGLTTMFFSVPATVTVVNDWMYPFDPLPNVVNKDGPVMLFQFFFFLLLIVVPPALVVGRSSVNLRFKVLNPLAKTLLHVITLGCSQNVFQSVS